MKLNINNTRPFKTKLGQLTEAEQASVNNHVRKLVVSYGNGKAYFNKSATQPYAFPLKNNLQSSLYSSRVSPNLRLIFSVDEDPLFNKLDFTLFDVTGKEQEHNRFRKIGERIYSSENLLS